MTVKVSKFTVGVAIGPPTDAVVALGLEAVVILGFPDDGLAIQGLEAVVILSPNEAPGGGGAPSGSARRPMIITN